MVVQEQEVVDPLAESLEEAAVDARVVVVVA